MSAIKSVVATINGQQYTLIYNSTSGAYEASVTAPTVTSYNVNELLRYHRHQAQSGRTQQPSC